MSACAAVWSASAPRIAAASGRALLDPAAERFEARLREGPRLCAPGFVLPGAPLTGGGRSAGRVYLVALASFHVCGCCSCRGVCRRPGSLFGGAIRVVAVEGLPLVFVLARLTVS